LAEKNKVVVSPAVYIDRNGDRYNLEVELPGVAKKDVILEVSEQTFCVTGSRDDVELTGCYYFSLPVDSKKAKATFESGLLKVSVPLAHSLTLKKIPIS
jgi:HSP20 family molecular chaperone IbpA